MYYIYALSLPMDEPFLSVTELVSDKGSMHYRHPEPAMDEPFLPVTGLMSDCGFHPLYYICPDLTMAPE